MQSATPVCLAIHCSTCMLTAEAPCCCSITQLRFRHQAQNIVRYVCSTACSWQANQRPDFDSVVTKHMQAVRLAHSFHHVVITLQAAAAQPANTICLGPWQRRTAPHSPQHTAADRACHDHKKMKAVTYIRTLCCAADYACAVRPQRSHATAAEVWLLCIGAPPHLFRSRPMRGACPCCLNPCETAAQHHHCNMSRS
ncbi:hypothetical protein COO60DRAFT_354788 [Scenedesmus sp. NREL 46B-D3]|nr:hypothetical protein COO60DRAFT_354788 [Scenedesmus sp. NREL 46B-D3]